MANFTKRLTRPTSSNLEYVRTASGGWSRCVQGSPLDSQCDALANCVGYACGRFNEIYNEITGHTGNKYLYLNCNAENFIERVQQMYPELKISSEPQPGAIVCWQKGATLNGSDGAGHVAVVEEILERDSNGKATSIRTSESAYGGKAFFTAIRNYNNGNWVNWANYTFRGFILNPAVITDSADEPIEYEVDSSKTPAIGDRVLINGSLYKSSGAESPVGSVSNTQTIVTRFSEGAVHPYNTTGDLGWMNAADVQVLKVKEKKKEQITLPAAVSRNTATNQVYVGNVILRIRKEANTDAEQIGVCEKNVYYNVLSTEKKTDYIWYQIGENAWCAGVEEVSYYAVQSETSETKDATVTELEQKLKEIETQITNLKTELSEAKTDAQNKTNELATAKEQLSKAETKIANIKKIIEE